jgi:hypothetical protein
VTVLKKIDPRSKDLKEQHIASARWPPEAINALSICTSLEAPRSKGAHGRGNLISKAHLPVGSNSPYLALASVTDLAHCCQRLSA